MATKFPHLTRIRRHPVSKCAGLLDFHKRTAERLALARKLGNKQTAMSYRRHLLDNAKVLRSKLLFKTDGTRL